MGARDLGWMSRPLARVILDNTEGRKLFRATRSSGPFIYLETRRHHTKTMPNPFPRILELLAQIRGAAHVLEGHEHPRIKEATGAILSATDELESYVPPQVPETEPETEPPTEPEPGKVTTRINRGGLVFVLAEAVPVRYSITGDPVVPPGTTVVELEPRTVTQDPGRRMHGAMLNPKPGTRQGYDTYLFAKYSGGSYSEELNAGARLPVTLQDGDSLVLVQSAQQRDTRPGIDRAAVLTCGTPPPGPFLRPWATEGGKFYRWSEVLQAAGELLPKRTLPKGFPGLGELAAGLEQLWLDHADTWASRYMHPRKWMPDYGRAVSDATGIALLAITYDHPMRDRLLAGLVQRGLDYAGWAAHALAQSNPGQRYMGAAAGHNNGRKALVALAGLLTADDTVGTAGMGGWSEEEQFFRIGQREITKGVGYTTALATMAEWGTNPVRQPEKSEAAWGGDPYRQCCTMNALWGHAAFAGLVDLRTHWPTVEVFVEYASRYLKTESELIDSGGAERWQLAWSEWSETALAEFIAGAK